MREGGIKKIGDRGGQREGRIEGRKIWGKGSTGKGRYYCRREEQLEEWKNEGEEGRALGGRGKTMRKGGRE